MSDEFFRKHFGLSGRKALITGGSRGIGRSIAIAFGAAGAEVCVNYFKSPEAAEQTASAINVAGGTAWTAQADLTQSSEANKLAAALKAKWGKLDILVNNAGDLVQRSLVADVTDELIDQVMKVNFHSCIYMIRACLPLLKLGTDPSILNLSSVAAHHGGANGATIYAASKGAILTTTRGLAKELAPIRVNGLAPGVVMTDFHRTHSKEDALKAIAASTPLKRIGDPDEMAAAAVFLSAPGASFITGEVIELNGGLWLA